MDRFSKEYEVMRAGKLSGSSKGSPAEPMPEESS
jgi:hypothetical protein